jgi:ABC-type transport system involved in cytochrome c biogenesis ATPase subunit
MLKLKDLILFSADSVVCTAEEIVFKQNSFNYIQGANSSGKSLLLKALAGDYKNYKGSISYFEDTQKNIFKTGDIVLLNGDIPVVEKKTFLENIKLPFNKFTEEKRIDMIEYASQLDLVDEMKKKMFQSSRCERMKMYLIRIALLNPKVLLIDDIECYFDEETFIKVYNLFVYCIKKGMMIITTGKAAIKNVPSYSITNGELIKL